MSSPRTMLVYPEQGCECLVYLRQSGVYPWKVGGYLGGFTHTSTRDFYLGQVQQGGCLGCSPRARDGCTGCFTQGRCVFTHSKGVGVLGVHPKQGAGVLGVTQLGQVGVYPLQG